VKLVFKFATAMLLVGAVGMTGSAVYAQSAAPAKKEMAAPKGPQITRNTIIDDPLNSILKDFDGVVYVTDIPPGMSSPRHEHPGWEFNYILKGSVSYEIDGQRPFTLKAGQATYNARGNIHRVWNPSKTEPAQLVAVLIKEKGKPLAITVPSKAPAP
jgi:quercetin dioxygenase-like cupin family protein